MRTIHVHDEWQDDYSYVLSEPAGKHFAQSFKPQLTPKQMLELGVFDGVYFWDRPKEFPDTWYARAKLSSDGTRDRTLNFFTISASKPLEHWQDKGWIHSDDPRGWFQWYARYYLGRRHEDDTRQIGRWRAFRRHWAAVQKYCRKGDFSCRRRQRQALLHWAYDSRKI